MSGLPVAQNRVANFAKVFFRDAGDLLHQLRGVLGVLRLHELEHGAGILQGRVGDGFAVLVHFVVPGRGVVAAFFRVKPGKEALLGIEGKIPPDQEGGVGVIDEIIFEVELVLLRHN